MAKYDKFTSPKNEGRPVQVESAIRDGSGKNIENNYAKQNGSYSTLTAGLAEGIATNRQIEDPELACPPITMGTTGGDAEIQTGNNPFENLEGASEKFNQLIPTKSINNTENGITIYSNNDGKFVVTVNNATGYNQVFLLQSSFNAISGHKYLISGQDRDNGIQVYPSSGGGTGKAYIYTSSVTSTISVFFYVAQTTPNETYTLYPMLIDLTAIYGAGNEPTTVEEFRKDYPCDYYAYNPGTILSAKSASLISRGRQQWDEQWEAGTIKLADGENQSSSTDWRSKNYIPVVPNATYHFHNGGTLTQIVIYFYDENKKYIAGDMRSAYNNKEFNFDTIANGLGAKYIKFVLYQASTHYGMTYNNDITISVFWEDGEGYDQYYPYEAQVVDLPNLELRSAGTAKDIVYSTGGGKRRIGIVDLGSLNWEYNQGSQTGIFRASSSAISDLKIGTHNVLCVKYIYGRYAVSDNTIWPSETNTTVFIQDNSFYDSTKTGQEMVAAFKTAMSGVYLLYELDEETDISTSENPGWTQLVKTDNYGTLQFVTDPAQIPQVEQPYFIKYTISLTEFLDSTYVRAEGDAKNLALQKDVDEIVSGAKSVGHAEFADNLTPYDEESGTSQEEPFILQASGTANGTLSDFASTSIAQLKEKRGNSIVVNQLLKPLTNTDWAASSGTVTFSNNIATFTASGQWGFLGSNLTTILGHKYLVIISIKLTTATTDVKLRFYDGGAQSIKSTSATTEWQTLSGIRTVQSINSINTIRISDERTSDWDAIQIKNAIAIDLTQWFGSNDNIPADIISHPENFFRYYQGSLTYTANPQIVDSNAQILKTVGRQQIDCEWEVGNISDGVPTPNDFCRRLTDYVKVIPNEKYHFNWYSAQTVTCAIAFYDANKNYIDTIYFYNKNYDFIVPANCCFIKIRLYDENWTASSNPTLDVTISIYFEGESGYDQYYPYEVLSEVDTGSEVLRSAGNARDYKTPDGTIHRLIKKVTITADNIVSCRQNEGNNLWTATTNIDIQDSKVKTWDAIIGIANNGYRVQHQSEYWGTDLSIGIYKTQEKITICNNSCDALAKFKALCPIDVYYELAEEVEEQGTPFAENMKIDDFGSMQWEGEEFNGIPMANLIFYPSDYKAFIDTLYDYTSGAPSNLVLQSERTADKAAQASTDSALQAAVGGTLRQCLCVKESLDFDNTAVVDLGSLTWAKSGDRFYVDLQGAKPNAVETAGKILCSAYKTLSANDTYSGYKGISIDTGSKVWVYDITYTDATVFKNAMKGVLLAYEKAE